MAQGRSFFDEAIAAGYGVFGLLSGEREVGRNFNASAEGVAGSFIALLAIVLLLCGLPMLLELKGFALHSLAAMGLTLVLQVSCALISLAQARRLDGFTAYLVADNWSSFYFTLIALALGFSGLDSAILGLLLDIVVLVLALNIARCLIGLAGWQIATFVMAQVCSQLAAELLVPILLPLPAVSS